MGGWGETAKAALKFNTRALLTRLGLWDALERGRTTYRYRRGRPHEPEFAFFRRFEGDRRLFVDGGANAGQSALSFRLFNTTCPILSFEPNPDLRPALEHVRRLLGESFDYRLCGLGAEAREVPFFVPVVRGVALTQEATLFGDRLLQPGVRRRIRAVTLSDDMRIEERRLKIVRFDDLDLRPGFVKLDVQGAELEALRGMERTLAVCRPLLMTEGCGRVRGFLEERGYHVFVYEPARHGLAPLSAAPTAYNFFFVPAEKAAEWVGPTRTAA
jgi:FkbM family methyltransferase